MKHKHTRNIGMNVKNMGIKVKNIRINKCKVQLVHPVVSWKLTGDVQGWK